MPLSSEDVVAINQLYASYNHAFDYGDVIAFSDQHWTESGELHSPAGVTRGHHQLRQGMEQIRSILPRMRHGTMNVLVDGDGDHAAGSAFLLAYQGGSEGFQVLQTGRYRDDLVKVDGRWLFSRREMVSD